MTPLPNYFIIRIDIKKQRERRDKIGILYTHFNQVHMTRNMQSGEIVAIGDKAHTQFPQAKIGDTLLVHHFVEGSGNDSKAWIFSDELYNYYNVTASNFNGRRNESYGVWNGKELIPHPSFIFVEPPIKEEQISLDEFVEKKTHKSGSLYLFNKWEETREQQEAKANKIMNEIKNQSVGKNMRDDVRRALEDKQHDAEKITANINKRRCKEPFKIAYVNPLFQKSYKGYIDNDNLVYALNQASETELEFNGKIYIVIETKYCVATA